MLVGDSSSWARKEISRTGSASPPQRLSPEVRLDHFLRDRQSVEGEGYHEKRTLAGLLHALRKHELLPEPLRSIAPPVLSSILQYRLFGPADPVMEARVDQYMRPLLERGSFHGAVLMVRDGVACVRKAYGKADVASGIDNTVHTRFQMASMAKPFTATAIMMLRERGALDREGKPLDLTSTVDKFIPDFPRGKEITIAQLLKHTSGIPSFPFRGRDHVDDTVPRTLDELVDIIKENITRHGLDFDTGSCFEYSNSGYILLAKIIEVASGHTWEDFLHDNIFGPLGMFDTGLETPGERDLAKGHALEDEKLVALPKTTNVPGAGGGGLCTTIGDFFLWDQELERIRTDPSYRGILSRESLESMLIPSGEPCVVIQRDGSIDASQEGPPSHSGYGWGVSRKFEHAVVEHTGGSNGFRTRITRFVDDHRALVYLTNTANHMHFFDLEQSLEKIALGIPVEPLSLPSEKPISPAILARYVGRYEYQPPEGDGPVIPHEITLEDGQLYLRVGDVPPFRIRPESDIGFFRKMEAWSVKFDVSADGQVHGIHITPPGQDKPAYVSRVS